MNALALLIGILVWANCADLPGVCSPDIRVERSESTLTIENACTAGESTGERLRYELIVDRIGRAGTSRSRQSGEFTVGSPSADTLSRTSISFSPGDSLNVRLLIFSGDTL